MYGNVVGGVLTVGVGQHSIEVCVERERAATVGTQEQTTLVIVVGMEIVPEDWRSTEYRGQLFDGGERYCLENDLWTCTGVGVEQFSVSQSTDNTHHSMYVQYTSQYICMYSTYAGVAPGGFCCSLEDSQNFAQFCAYMYIQYKSHNYAVLSV